MRLVTVVMTFLFGCCAGSLLLADDWTQFRGPNSTGVSNDAVTLEWDAKTNIEWQTELSCFTKLVLPPSFRPKSHSNSSVKTTSARKEAGSMPLRRMRTVGCFSDPTRRFTPFKSKSNSENSVELVRRCRCTRAMRFGYRHVRISNATLFELAQCNLGISQQKSHDMSLHRHDVTSILKRDNPCPALPVRVVIKVIGLSSTFFRV